MPPKNHKKKASGRPPPKGISAEYIGEIENADGWFLIIQQLGKHLNLPDLTTRSGLRKVHAEFDTIYRRLNATYEQNSGNVKIMGAVAGTYAQMCVDVLLRDKLFEKGFLDKMIPLLKHNDTRHLVLRALSNITHHGGEDVRVAVASQANNIAQTLLDFPDDRVGAELSVAVLSHSLVAVVFFEKQSIDQKLFNSLNMQLIFRSVIAASKHKAASPYIIGHASELITMATLNCTKACHDVPETISLLVAGLRSKDWSHRCSCLGGLIRLPRRDAEDDTRNLDPQRLMDSVRRGFPDNIADILMNYGTTSCDTYITLQSTSEFTKAMTTYSQDRNRDIYPLALKIAELIPRNEFSIVQGAWQSEDPRTGAWEIMDIGLPFTWWADSLPHCARSLREHNHPDLADMLDIKYAIMQQRLPQAFEMARRGLERNPNFAYYHYARSLTADAELGLKSSKKGLKCRESSPFIRFQLLQRSVQHAGDLGISKLQDVREIGDSAWKEGTAFLLSALEDSRLFIKEAPPDNRYMKNVLYYNILLRLAIEGPDISVDLHELNATRKQLKITEEIANFVGVGTPKTGMRVTQDIVLKRYAAAATEWGDVIIKRDADSEIVDTQPHTHAPTSSQTVDASIAAWVEGLSLEDTAKPPKPCRPARTNPTITSNYVALYRCSWCENPSAVLKRCVRCTKTRYCDEGCQKAHWKEHKKVCKA
ncbi:hypothetical protein CYLTODRAFT_425967 [Cylindrobasidium torrendii FP15055 ss-10]|uniref:MYND-type domain-containing protein n=1 Tax=Cylindrobasidium torrendii FP15055 ss-10 TaxID=1314674 RepID=A0A0D7B064_9AGAR|nr:hypothetical protein CYLTODRAFT_425967 [Cylindrobasidium torrendii FP15055 ss-10]